MIISNLILIFFFKKSPHKVLIFKFCLICLQALGSGSSAVQLNPFFEALYGKIPNPDPISNNFLKFSFLSLLEKFLFFELYKNYQIFY